MKSDACRGSLVGAVGGPFSSQVRDMKGRKVRFYPPVGGRSQLLPIERSIVVDLRFTYGLNTYFSPYTPYKNKEVTGNLSSRRGSSPSKTPYSSPYTPYRPRRGRSIAPHGVCCASSGWCRTSSVLQSDASSRGLTTGATGQVQRAEPHAEPDGARLHVASGSGGARGSSGSGHARRCAKHEPE
jgi:hypothetical protein